MNRVTVRCCLSTGRSGLILDVVIEAGNPADAERLLPMLDRHIAQYGQPPRQLAADGGYASLENLHAAKARQVTDVVFHKKRGLKIEEMARSPWVYRKLRNFRAGIEAGISCLKRAYGLGRCTWIRLAHFKAYVVLGGGPQPGFVQPFSLDLTHFMAIRQAGNQGSHGQLSSHHEVLAVAAGIWACH